MSISNDLVWDIEPGGFLTRSERAERFGGGTQSGIEPSNRASTVFLYTDPAKGLAHGYNFDGWSPDRSVFFYTGEGQYGDQTLSGRNASILNHREARRTLRMFSAEGTVGRTQTKQQRYIGEFEVDRDRPFEWEIAPDTGGELRSVVVFRLRPAGRTFARSREDSAHPISPVTLAEEVAPLEGPVDDVVEQVLLERTLTPQFLHHDEGKLRVAVRREAELVTRMTRYLRSLGHEVARNKIVPAGSAFPLFTDIHDVTGSVVYEAKASPDRPQVRLAVGQLMDYRRYLGDSVGVSALFPRRPAEDLPALLALAGVALSYPQGSTFRLPFE
ncbi:hypothetical protein [Naasia sp. SYSU D00948]|uniref:hypothetical protein n=1 Tax=Naasia sp. SYSU D00948 TaxID=2817379 RepID=UPI001B307EB9|nr:hypothetical protein [Naasia sp. SYSU D00948]